MTEAIGVLAAICTTIGWIPQLSRTVRTRATTDLSWGYVALFVVGVLAWMGYGFLREDAVLAGANLVSLVLLLAIVVLKWHYER